VTDNFSLFSGCISIIFLARRKNLTLMMSLKASGFGISLGIGRLMPCLPVLQQLVNTDYWDIHQ
jgi:hypothetical protein